MIEFNANSRNTGSRCGECKRLIRGEDYICIYIYITDVYKFMLLENVFNLVGPTCFK